MEASNELQRIWKQQQIEIPEVEKLVEKANAFKRRGLLTIIIASIASLICVSIIVLVWIYYDSELIITKIGMFLVLLGVLIYGIAYLTNLPLLTKPGFEMNTKQYLEQIKKLKKQQQFMQNRMLTIYYILLSIGLSIYMYEPASSMPGLFGLIAYGLTFGWILTAWFYLRPKQIKKNNEKIDKLLVEFERVNAQIEE